VAGRRVLINGAGAGPDPSSSSSVRMRARVLAVKEGPAHFGPLADLCTAGRVTIRIDGVVPLDLVPAALARVGEGRALATVVVEVS
jgi:Zinc-binding dehydrogenase